MEGYWKMLDNMNESNPDQYKKFIDDQMGEMKDHMSEEEKAAQLKSTINSDAYFSFSVRPTRLVSKTEKKPEKKEDIKLFDFGSSEIKESFVNNPD